MSTVGDALPEEIRLQYIEERLQPGAVIRIHTNLSSPPKIKRFIIIRNTRDGYLGVIFINSNINFNVYNTPELVAFQYPLRQEDHNGIIDRDCHADCTQFIGDGELTKESVIRQLLDNPENILGQLDDTHFSEIVRLIRTSPLMSKKRLRRFGLA